MRAYVVVVLAATLAGCGTYLPQLTSDQALPLDVLIAKINCEFQVAVWTQRHVKRREFLAGWQGQYGVTIKSNETGSAKSLGNTFPFFPAKNVAGTGAFGVGASTTANRTAIMKFSLAFDDVKQEPTCARIETTSLHPFIAGRIGFEEWMNRVFDAAEDAGDKLPSRKPQRISSAAHSFEFMVVANANGGAGFLIGPPPIIGINGAVTAERVDDGVVDLTIARPAIDPLPELLIGLTKAERDLIAKLEELINQKKSNIAQRNQEINKAPLSNRLSTMDSKTIQGLSPNDVNQLQAFKLDPSEAEQLKALNALRDANSADEKELLALTQRRADIQPRITGVTTKPRVLPPDRNPEIIYTTQQLTLERLNNSLRIIP